MIVLILSVGVTILYVAGTVSAGVVEAIVVHLSGHCNIALSPIGGGVVLS